MAKEEYSIRFFFWWQTRLGLRYFAIYHLSPSHLNTEEPQKKNSNEKNQQSQLKSKIDLFWPHLNLYWILWSCAIAFDVNVRCACNCSPISIAAPVPASVPSSTPQSILHNETSQYLYFSTNIVRMLFPTSTVAYIWVVPHATNNVSMFGARAHISQLKDCVALSSSYLSNVPNIDSLHFCILMMLLVVWPSLHLLPFSSSKHRRVTNANDKKNA